MKKLFYTAIVMMSLSFFSCSDNDVIPTSDVNLTVALPTSLSGNSATLKSANLELTNVNTGVVETQTLTSLTIPTLNVEDGLYNISIEGEVSYVTMNADSVNVTVTETVRAIKENIEISGGDFSDDIDLFIYKESAGFVFSEIFFAGTKTPEGDQYNSDKYFEIYNNSDTILYADGLCIAESQLLSTMALNEYTPDIRSEYAPVKSVYRIPGDGTQYPIEPGEVFIVCDQAINHKEGNSNSFDLSIAKFEWFDGADVDIDVPEVPNLEKMVSTSSSSWSLHNRGFKSYVLFKMDGVTPEEFTTDYAYYYEYTFVWGDFVKVMDFDAWKVPNSLIIDAVECSTPSEYEWKTIDPSLDLTWTHSGDADDARYGKSVKRKVDHTETDGRKVLLDTNSSAFDFIATAEPSPGTIE